MIEICFSKRHNGACPICENFSDCRILREIKVNLESTIKGKYDETMEIVVYRCPDFTEAMK